MQKVQDLHCPCVWCQVHVNKKWNSVCVCVCACACVCSAGVSAVQYYVAFSASMWWPLGSWLNLIAPCFWENLFELRVLFDGITQFSKPKLRRGTMPRRWNVMYASGSLEKRATWRDTNAWMNRVNHCVCSCSWALLADPDVFCRFCKWNAQGSVEVEAVQVLQMTIHLPCNICICLDLWRPAYVYSQTSSTFEPFVASLILGRTFLLTLCGDCPVQQANSANCQCHITSCKSKFTVGDIKKPSEQLMASLGTLQ